MRPIEIYSNGLIHCSVCAPKEMTREEVESEVNRVNPTGVDGPWKVSEGLFSGGQPNPFDAGDCGTHWLLVC